MLDLTLAIAHHIVIFALFGVLIAELAMAVPRLSGASIERLVAIDLWYGILALAILIIGFSRAIFAAKGWAYYSVNTFFWAKIATFVLIGLISVIPTIRYIAWRRAYRQTGALPDDGAVASNRMLLWIQCALFALLPAFAAAMARGYGE